MGKEDLQIGATWTHPAHRGQGLAAAAICEIVAQCQAPGRAFWYLCDVANAASIKAVEKAGFKRVGAGSIRKRLGLGMLGEYVMEEVQK